MDDTHMFVGMSAFCDTLASEVLALLPSGDPEETKAYTRKK